MRKYSAVRLGNQLQVLLHIYTYICCTRLAVCRRYANHIYGIRMIYDDERVVSR